VHQPGDRDLIRSLLHQTHRSVVRPPGRHAPSPSHGLEGRRHHHHRTPAADPGDRRGRHPQGRPRRAAKDALGRRLATTRIPTTPTGYQDLLAWAHGLGEVDAFGVEGTSSYGAGLARFLRGHGQRVVEVNRPDRQARRRNGKSDPVDADAAARAVQAGEATAAPKLGTGTVAMVRPLRTARQTAIKARTQTINATRPCW
jgi:transposase